MTHEVADDDAVTIAVPMELQLMVMQELADAHSSPTSQRRGIASYACVSKDWQAFFEGMTFKHFVLGPCDLPSFRQLTRHPRRRDLVRHIWLRIQKPLQGRREELDFLEDSWTRSNSAESAIVLHLWTTLSTWKARDGGQKLTLELSSHTYVGLVKYARYAPPDDIGLYSKYLETGFLESYSNSEKYGHTSPKWYDEVAPCTAKLAGATVNLFTWGRVEFDEVQLPRVGVVTKLLTRRGNTRNIKAKGLAQIIGSLPRLEEIHLERWRLGRAAQEQSWLRGKVYRAHDTGRVSLELTCISRTGVADQLGHGMSPSVKKFAIFHEEIEPPHFAYNRPWRAPRNELDEFLAKGTLHLERLSLCFLVEAEDFFRHLLGVAEENKRGSSVEQNHQTAPNLTSLTMTSARLKLWENDGTEEPTGREQVRGLLLLAAAAAEQMPQLQLMEIWNGRDGGASIFRYKVSDGFAKIIWSSTNDLEVLSGGVAEAWERTALVHERQQLRTEVIRLPDGGFEYYGSVLPHLDSMEEIIHPVSAAQIT